jgi:hypothetical protein
MDNYNLAGFTAEKSIAKEIHLPSFTPRKIDELANVVVPAYQCETEDDGSTVCWCSNNLLDCSNLRAYCGANNGVLFCNSNNSSCDCYLSAAG